ncbi:hypothetical protein D915_004901 [Fasciola hepatica]|uniref:Uncharacterized protein n=1 Tax=Fasciola hepatica TaxID=6192 RepID=A0A4E0RTW7_FASHE|nr:hypothetical protein D915_004901 [Fasciola hepatica]
MTPSRFVLLFLCLTFGDVDCEETLLETVDAVNAEITQWRSFSTKFSTKLTAIIRKMKDDPLTAKERLFAKELKREEQKENERLQTTALHGVMKLRQSLEEIKTFDTLLGQMYLYLSNLAVKWSQNQNPLSLSGNENELVYFLQNGRILSIKYSTEIQKNFLSSLKRAMERTVNLQGNLDRLAGLIQLNFPAH